MDTDYFFWVAIRSGSGSNFLEVRCEADWASFGFKTDFTDE